MIPIYDLNTDAGQSGYQARLDKLRRSSILDGQWSDIAGQVIDDVASRGDEAIVEQMQRFTDPDFSMDRIRVTEAELESAQAQIPVELKQAIETSIGQVRAYQQHVMPKTTSGTMSEVEIGGAKLGMKWTPMASAGLLVPGGSAVLFSTAIMLAVPAITAGVPADQLAVVTPPPTRSDADEPARDVSPITLGVCHMLGVSKVYRIGGPAAVAALAMGAQSVEAVDFIAGPGHPVTQAAKLRVQGRVGIDGFYGASEVVVIADDSADPKRVACDLLAQAEHNPGKCFLVAWQTSVVDKINEAIRETIAQLPRRDAIENALRDDSCAVICSDADQAVDIANALAGEHVTLAVSDPEAWVARIDHGGELFLSDTTPVASGDYYVGPSHCLPTGTTARFSSGVSVYTFLKRTGTVRYLEPMPSQAIDHIAAMARAEGLEAHAASVEARKK